jgi:hypothetical protein
MEGKKVLQNIKKNNYKLYYKHDVEKFGLPMFPLYKTPDNFYSQSRLKRELKLVLNEEQANTPHGFSQGRNGYYPVWDYNKLEAETEKKNSHWIDLIGSVELDENTDLDKFSDEFIDWLESKGWAFFGSFKPNENEEEENDSEK